MNIRIVYEYIGQLTCNYCIADKIITLDGNIIAMDVVVVECEDFATDDDGTCICKYTIEICQARQKDIETHIPGFHCPVDDVICFDW